MSPTSSSRLAAQMTVGQGLCLPNGGERKTVKEAWSRGLRLTAWHASGDRIGKVRHVPELAKWTVQKAWKPKWSNWSGKTTFCDLKSKASI